MIFPLKKKVDSYKTNWSCRFGAPRDPGRKHGGCDLAAGAGSDVLAVADGKEAGAGTAKVRHQEKEGAQRIDTKMCTDPWQPDGKGHGWGGVLWRQQLRARKAQERDAELVRDGRSAVGMTVGIPKRQAGKEQKPKDDLDDLMDALDEMEI